MSNKTIFHTARGDQSTHRSKIRSLETTSEFDPYLSFLKRVLTPPRYWHSLGVMRVMAELAEIYALHGTPALIAGFLHDAAKDLPSEHQLMLAEEAGIKFRYPCERLPVYLHGPVGAYLVSKELGITDRLILDAISTHSYSGNGSHFDSPLSWCLWSADILAPTKEWEGMKKLKQMVYAGKLEEATLLQVGWLMEYFEQLGIPIHPNLPHYFEVLSARLSADVDFFDRW